MPGFTFWGLAMKSAKKECWMRLPMSLKRGPPFEGSPPAWQALQLSSLVSSFPSRIGESSRSKPRMTGGSAPIVGKTKGRKKSVASRKDCVRKIGKSIECSLLDCS